MNACPTCGYDDDDGVPGWHLCSGMRRVGKAPALPLEVVARLNDFMDEADRCRGRAAAEARFYVIG